MVGKSYTMREMKTIVDYLVEHKAYSETKGRKMWKDFASSKLTDRSWQSLKETFLKRILPDIHNPYYKLTMEQIASLRQGFDVEQRINNKLDIRTISDDSNADDNIDSEKPSTSKSQAEKPGEGITCSKASSHHRSSAETLILDNENSEEAEKEANNASKVSTNVEDQQPEQEVKSLQERSFKSLRDLITYTDPLTPMLQEVLHDFDSDDDEPPMQICEDEIIPCNEINTNNNGLVEATLTILNKDNNDIESIVEIDEENNQNKELEVPKTVNGHTSPSVLEKTDLKSNTTVEDSIGKNNSTQIISKGKDETSKPLTASQSNSLRVSSATEDTQLPNNQEQLPENTEQINNKDVTKKIEGEPVCKETSKKQKSLKLKGPDKKTKSIKKPMNKAINTLEIVDSSEGNAENDVNNKESNVDSDKVCVEETNNNIAKDLTYNITNSEDITLSQKKNPCLQSVSLYDEQFSASKLSESESSVKELGNKSPAREKDMFIDVANKIKESIILKSNSDTESEESDKIVQTKTIQTNPDRDRALDRVFGFSGENMASRKTKSSYKKACPRKYFTHHLPSGSSEWTSESDNEYVSPPRSRKYKNIRKVLKPKSARVLSLEEEGGLFVIHGKKIYPLIKNGKILKHLTYLPESDSEEEKESYWKSKYVQEKIRAAELSKLLEQVKGDSTAKCSSPILQANSSKQKKLTINDGKNADVRNDTKDLVPVEVDKNVEREEKCVKIKFTKNNEEVQLEGNWQNLHPVIEQVISIFHKDSNTKGESTDIQNNLEERKKDQSIESRRQSKTQITGRTKENKATLNTNILEIQEDERITISSGERSPVEEVPYKAVQEKVDQLENDIFSEIEELEKEHSETSKEIVKNVTTRKKRTVLLKSESPAKRIKLKPSLSEVSGSDKQDSPKKDTRLSSTGKATSPKNLSSSENLAKTLSPQGKDETPKRQSIRTPKRQLTPKESPTKTKKAKVTTGKQIKNTLPVKRGRPRSKPAITSPTKVTPVTTVTEKPPPKKKKITPPKGKQLKSEGVMSPPKKKTPVKNNSQKKVDGARKSVSAITKSSPKKKKLSTKISEAAAEKKDSKRKSSIKINKTKKSGGSSSTNISVQSESTQGYQDSNDTTVEPIRRKKKKVSVSTSSLKGNNKYRRSKRFSVSNGNDASSESSNLSNYRTAPNTAQNSSNTEAYKSESYQLLFPKNQSAFGILQRIDERDRSLTVQGLRPDQEEIKEDQKSNSSDNLHINVALQNSSQENSSNCLLSPEISIVEKLSLTKSDMSIVECPTTCDAHTVTPVIKIMNKFMLSDVDVTMPLMGQDCELQKKISEFRRSQEPNLLSTDKTMESPPRRMLTESVIDQICTVNIDKSHSASDSLDEKLRDLLLESAKKASSHHVQVEKKSKVDSEPKLAKKVSKKRSSTPIKRKSTKNSNYNEMNPVLEEHTDSCSYSGRKSCPPILHILSNKKKNNNALDYTASFDNVLVSNQTNIKNIKKKKDVIKVKILKPKSKSNKKSPNEAVINNTAEANNVTENESGIFLKGINDSVDLIHNHSETCLQAHNCIENSIEILEKSESVTSLDSVCNSMEINLEKSIFSGSTRIQSSNELFCDNAQDSSAFTKATTPSPIIEDFETGANIITPLSGNSYNSLITEDLSEESLVETAPKPRSWDFFSENETTNSKLCTVEPEITVTNCAKDGSNLLQIFPITCAVPDLSTITEQEEISLKSKIETDYDIKNDT